MRTPIPIVTLAHAQARCIMFEMYFDGSMLSFLYFIDDNGSERCIHDMKYDDTLAYSIDRQCELLL